jgi:tRNA G10  N-methylase Trm11
MRLFCIGLSILISAASYAIAEEVPKKIRSEIMQQTKLSLQSDYTRINIAIVKHGKADPPKEIVKEYKPKAAYCITCKITGCHKKTPRQKLTFLENYIVIITKEGKMKTIDEMSIIRDEKRKRDSPTTHEASIARFKSLWKETCPYSYIESQ